MLSCSSVSRESESMILSLRGNGRLNFHWFVGDPTRQWIRITGCSGRQKSISLAVMVWTTAKPSYIARNLTL